MNLTLWDPENLNSETFLSDTIRYMNTGVRYVILDLNDDSEQSHLSEDISEAVASGDIETTGKSVTVEEAIARIDKALAEEN